MSNYSRPAWCRFCRAILPHNFIDHGETYQVVCSNCGRQTPIRAFERHEERRLLFNNSRKQKWDME